MHRTATIAPPPTPVPSTPTPKALARSCDLPPATMGRGAPIVRLPACTGGDSAVVATRPAARDMPPG
ncbi:hypothetical protein VI08_09715 [Luteibacter yeojuensis]|uniref:Uncharacterized protein n=1 Tax=Luteibacter yeojuensis TaxID=345309 RepID=A0A0F3KUK0_9GAMM|nr:hypothetical protein VI08_09715 [Luteibacter yeojuensis]